MGSVGHITGYTLGAVDLVKVFGASFGDTQFKKLTVIAALGMFTTSTVTCWAVGERVYVSGPADQIRGRGRLRIFRQIWSTLRNLPPRIQAICWVVFWSWIGWYPFLVYGSTWVGEIYFRYDLPDNLKDSKDALGDMGRVGSTALTFYSIVTFLSAWILPLCVVSPDDDHHISTGLAKHLPTKVTEQVNELLEKFNKVKPNLLTTWFCSSILFAGAMCLAPFAANFRFATVLVAMCGMPWAITMWAPPTFLGVEVNKLSGQDGAGGSYRRLSTESAIEMASHDPDGSGLQRSEESPDSSSRELSGIYFGILNIYTTLPQFVGTFISSIVFAVLEPGKSPELATDAHPSEHHSTDGPNAISICLFIGAISAVASAYATRRLMYMP
jgi:solute carrier family 45 protein 1/2/4